MPCRFYKRMVEGFQANLQGGATLPAGGSGQQQSRCAAAWKCISYILDFYICLCDVCIYLIDLRASGHHPCQGKWVAEEWVRCLETCKIGHVSVCKNVHDLRHGVFAGGSGQQQSRWGS